MVIPGYNVRQQLDKNSVHTNSPEETGESYCHFIQYSGELQSSSKISEGTTIHVICTVASTRSITALPFLSSEITGLIHTYLLFEGLLLCVAE